MLGLRDILLIKCQQAAFAIQQNLPRLGLLKLPVSEKVLGLLHTFEAWLALIINLLKCIQQLTITTTTPKLPWSCFFYFFFFTSLQLAQSVYNSEIIIMTQL